MGLRAEKYRQQDRRNVSMDRLDTVVSEVCNFIDSLGTGYVQFDGQTAQIREDVRGMQERVLLAADAASNQCYKARQLETDASSKYHYNMGMCESAFRSMRDASERIDYILANPIEIVETDDQGNEYIRREIDQVQLAVWQREYERAQTEYYYYSGKRDNAKLLMDEANSAAERLENLKKAIVQLGQHIDQQLQAIEGFRQDMNEEANFNLTAMANVRDKMIAYLNCKPIYMAQ